MDKWKLSVIPDMIHRFPQLTLNPSLPVFAVYQHAIKDDLSLFTTTICFDSWI